MNFKIRASLFFLATILFMACSSTQKGIGDKTNLRIAFYNVENLFDLQDDPLTLDEDFTPIGKQEWTQERYETKLSRIDQIVKDLQYPALVGLCEVENKTVLKGLCETTSLKEKDYQFVHFDSPDRRGIDVALLYKTGQFKVRNSEIVRIDFPDEIVPDEPGYTSRDILVVEGVLAKKTKVHVFVCHFPSRFGGVEKSQPKRLQVARYLRKKMDEIMALKPASQIILMGDFNDEPDNKSIAEILNAEGDPLPPGSSNLFNCFAKLDNMGKGSYNYRGNWNMLDQIILSAHFIQINSKLSFDEAYIFQREYMMYEDKKYGKRPNRTYGGPRYFGGYSDHLPVFIELK